MSRRWLLSTTTLSTVASAMVLTAQSQAADLYVSPPPPQVIHHDLAMPAVSEFNAKIDGRFGVSDGEAIALGAAALSVPLGQRFGAQVGGFAGTVGGNLFLQGEGHIFWRDPSWLLFGLYGAYSHLNRPGGAFALATVAGEAELYLNNITLSGVVGYQFSQNKPVAPDSFFADLKAALYVTKDLKIYGGYRYDQRLSQGVIGGEWQAPLNMSTGVSIFGEGRFGSATEAWGGLRLYFGPRKSLIDRHRQDDPPMILIIPHGRNVAFTPSTPPA